ncbi:MAG: DNA mismatch repair protein [Byssovorax sp.]
MSSPLMPALLPPPRALGPIPDLLSVEPALRIDASALGEVLVFAFATGGAVESFDDILARASLPPTSWDRAHFARDLFLEQLVEHAFPVRIGGRAFEPCRRYLLRAITEPPRAMEEIAFRRAILDELATSKTARAELEAIYVELVRLRTMLCSGRITSATLRRLDILRSVHTALSLLSTSFAGARSGLARLRDFGEAVTRSPAYERLDALLDHEAHLGTVDLRVRVGSDGELRTFQILAVRENSDNPFHTSAIGRWISRIRLFLRGYRMNGGEVVEQLFDDVFTGLEGSLVLCFQLLGDIELYLGSLGFRDRAAAKGLDVCFADLVEGSAGATMRFSALFNPLLLGDKLAPVPCDLRVEHAASVVIVTGPNSGGKTRLLQAIAVGQLLAEGGLFVPAKEARLPRMRGLFVSLIEDARADQPEGQLGMELLRIRRMFEHLEPGSLVLLDELCSGTNPSEGEEIARLVISLLPELRAQVFVTTHLLQFAARLAEERPIARLSFLQVELGERDVPTYGFVPGVAKTSLAHKTAARLGVTRDELLSLIAARKRATGEPRSLPADEEPPPPPALPSAARGEGSRAPSEAS